MDHLGIHAIARESRSYSCRKSSSGGRWWGPPRNTVMKLDLALAAEVTAGPFHARLFVVPTFPICLRPIGRKRKGILFVVFYFVLQLRGPLWWWSKFSTVVCMHHSGICWIELCYRQWPRIKRLAPIAIKAEALIMLLDHMICLINSIIQCDFLTFCTLVSFQC